MSFIQPNIRRGRFNASPETDVNILMMGETGNGKSTFINAFANYLLFQTLDDAKSGQMQVLIPAVFNVVDPNTNDSKQVSIGNANDNEQCQKVGQSSTQTCRSYIFPIGNRLLRLIDAPGIGDVRGIQQDAENCDHILSYISRLEHLNGICVLLKPNVERLTVGFRFCIKEILTHLHITAKDNLMFVFTNARSTFYKPGATTPILRALLQELNQQWNVEIPFNTGNSFMFENEAFRFLATYKNRIRFSEEEENSFAKSWAMSVKETKRLIERIMQCELHAVRDSLSINSARQLIHLLSRPIGEIARLIQENINLAQQHKQKVLSNTCLTLPNRIPQLTGRMKTFDYPRTVCTTTKCTEVIVIDNQQKVDYKTKCHSQCYLKGIERECIGHPSFRYCKAMNRVTGFCNVCGCNWDKHMHISYEYEKHTTYIDIDNSSSRSVLASIDKRISDLRQEEASIMDVCKKLTKFLRQYSMITYNDDIVEYIRYFIHEEEIKSSAGANNESIIEGLRDMIKEHENEQKLYKATSNNQTAASDKTLNNTELEPTDIFGIVEKLYELPINGQSIRQQVGELKRKQLEINPQNEHFVEISSSDGYAPMAQELKEIINRK